MGEEILRVENLTKIYPGGVLANYNINFSINKGEIHALVGENGAGKSTLMKMLFGIEEITSGTVFLHGKEVHFQSSKDAIEAGIGMGSTSWQLLWKIKLPLALPVIMAGIRNMVVMVIATCGIASFIGAGGLGVAIFRGI